MIREKGLMQKETQKHSILYSQIAFQAKERPAWTTKHLKGEYFSPHKPFQERHRQ